MVVDAGAEQKAAAAGGRRAIAEALLLAACCCCLLAAWRGWPWCAGVMLVVAGGEGMDSFAFFVSF